MHNPIHNIKCRLKITEKIKLTGDPSVTGDPSQMENLL